MPADIASKPFDANRKYKHVYLCEKYPMIRLVFKRKEKAGDSEQYIGFLKHSVGGIFQTDSAEVAEFMDSVISDGEHGHEFEKISHEDLAKRMAKASGERTRVNRGPTASRQTDLSEHPEEEAGGEREVRGTKGPRSGKGGKGKGKGAAAEPESEGETSEG